MARVLVLTSEPAGADALPALALLSHEIHTAPLEPAAPAGEFDVVVVDGRRDLATARATCRLAALTAAPVLLVLGEGGFAAVTAEWGASDVVLAAAGPAEVEARMRLVATGGTDESGNIEIGELSIDPEAYIARLRGRVLDLTYREFELLRHLAQHPGRVFTRTQLLSEVWGYDYYGGTRTVDVHIRRLRAKLGPEHDQLIGTVRNVGYRFTPRAAET